jgi:uncharacterized protein YbjT (DUF2867 family)
MIGVLGATGRIGGHVAAALAAAGVDARALVRRPPAKALPLPAVHADLTDPATVRQALRGVTRLLLVTPHGPDQDLLEATAIDAAAEAGVGHVVKVSGSAASLGPNGTTPTAIAHWRSEQRIEASGMDFTFLRPSFFMQNLGELRAAPFARVPIAMVDLRDVAACAAAVLLEPSPTDGAWQLTGPRAVTPASLGVRHVPMWVARRALARKPAFERDHGLRMAEYLAAGSDGAVTDHVLRLTGTTPRSAEFFKEEAA